MLCALSLSGESLCLSSDTDSSLCLSGGRFFFVVVLFEW